MVEYPGDIVDRYGVHLKETCIPCLDLRIDKGSRCVLICTYILSTALVPFLQIHVLNTRNC